MILIHILCFYLLIMYSNEQDTVLSHPLDDNKLNRPVIRLVFNDDNSNGFNALLNTYIPFSIFDEKLMQNLFQINQSDLKALIFYLKNKPN